MRAAQGGRRRNQCETGYRDNPACEQSYTERTRGGVIMESVTVRDLFLHRVIIRPALAPRRPTRPWVLVLVKK